MGQIKYSAHAYGWTSSWSNETLGLIDKAKELGFDLLEIPIMEIDKVDAPRIRARCEAAGIGVIGSLAISEATDITAEDKATRERGVEYLKRCIKATAEMGATVMTGVTYSAIGRKLETKPDERYWERSAKNLKRVAKYAQDFGVTIGLEPVNRYETFLINTAEQAVRLVKMIDEPNVGIHLDAYHMNIEENDFYTPTKLAAPYVCHVHLSESHRGVPGTGTVDWEGIYRALVECDYTGMVGLESFIELTEALRASTCIWRTLAPSTDYLYAEGLRYLKGVEAKTRRELAKGREVAPSVPSRRQAAPVRSKKPAKKAKKAARPKGPAKRRTPRKKGAPKARAKRGAGRGRS
ncbi:MAG: sugar phosphate isomerase/epimerase [Verrucomicrobia bacterium]|nr:sugar phosphate isomerase/epimerase [Verrucomicrobiota bacterium]